MIPKNRQKSESLLIRPTHREFMYIQCQLSSLEKRRSLRLDMMMVKILKFTSNHTRVLYDGIEYAE